MQQKSLTKYYIGFIILGLFVIILLLLVVVQAQSTKDDTDTYNKATTIANNLSQFISVNNYVPASLKNASVSSIPQVSYQRLSSDSFKFCVKYKATSSDFNPTAVVDGLITNTLEGPNQPTNDNTFLYLSPDHHSGNNCQTIEPTLVSGYSPDLLNSGSNTSSI